MEPLIAPKLQDTPADGVLHAKSESACTSAVQAHVTATHRASALAWGTRAVLYHARVLGVLTPAPAPPVEKCTQKSRTVIRRRASVQEAVIRVSNFLLGTFEAEQQNTAAASGGLLFGRK